MHGLAGVAREVLQGRQRLPAQLLVAHRGRAQGVHAHPERVAAGFGVFVEVAEVLDRVQEAEDGGLGLAKLGGEFGQAPAFLPCEAVDHLEPFAERTEQVGIARRGGGISHGGMETEFLERRFVNRTALHGKPRPCAALRRTAPSPALVALSLRSRKMPRC